MPFGLSNALASFQRYINRIQAKKLDIFVIVYLDNIFIYTTDLGQPHINVLCGFLKNWGKNSLFANRKKCWFYKDKVCFLDYIVLVQGVQIKTE